MMFFLSGFIGGLVGGCFGLVVGYRAAQRRAVRGLQRWTLIRRVENGLASDAVARDRWRLLMSRDR